MSHTDNWVERVLPDPEEQRAYAEELAILRGVECLDNAISESGLSRSEIAEKLGWHKSMITRLLSGPHNMTFATLGAVLWACDKELRELSVVTLGSAPSLVPCGKALRVVTMASENASYPDFHIEATNLALSA